MPLGARTSEVAGQDIVFEAVPYAALSGWDADDHLAAFRAFVRSAPALARASTSSGATSGKTCVAGAALLSAAQRAQQEAPGITKPEEAKAFFEASTIATRAC
jgi:membrane-bound lytic murein transglycosylase A